MVSETDESNDKPVLREELAELERRINQRIVDSATTHDRTTQAYVDGLNKSIDARFDEVNEELKGVHERIDKLEETVQKQSDDSHSKFDRVLDALEKMDSNITSQMQDMRQEFTSQIQDMSQEFTSQIQGLDNKISAGLTAQLTENDNRHKNRITLLVIVVVLYTSVMTTLAGCFIYALSAAT